MVSRPRSSRTLSQFIRAMPANDELSPIIAEIGGEANDRAAVIMGAAVLDGALESAIIRKFRKLPESDLRDLFGVDSPLGSFSAKIRIGYALRIFGARTKDDLNAIREVRNAFAHTRLPLSFQMTEVANVAKRITFAQRLVADKYEPNTTLSAAYRLACVFLIVYFHGVGRGAKRSSWRGARWLEIIAE